MKDKNRIANIGHVEYPESAGLVANTNLPNSRANGLHRFPVARIESDLHLEQLHTGFFSRRERKLPNLPQGIS
jgi:hypothetical protein